MRRWLVPILVLLASTVWAAPWPGERWPDVGGGGGADTNTTLLRFNHEGGSIPFDGCLFAVLTDPPGTAPPPCPNLSGTPIWRQIYTYSGTPTFGALRCFIETGNGLTDANDQITYDLAFFHPTTGARSLSTATVQFVEPPDEDIQAGTFGGEAAAVANGAVALHINSVTDDPTTPISSPRVTCTLQCTGC